MRPAVGSATFMRSHITESMEWPGLMIKVLSGALGMGALLIILLQMFVSLSSVSLRRSNSANAPPGR